MPIGMDIANMLIRSKLFINGLKTSGLVKKLIEFINGLTSQLFTGQLVVNFHNGNIGKIQITKTLKSSDLNPKDI